MTSRLKHAQRAHRSYHRNLDFSTFQRNASLKKAKEAQKLSFLEMMKGFFHKTTNK